MKKIIFVFSLVAFSFCGIGCGSDCCKKPSESSSEKATTTQSNETAMYECPMKCTPASDKAGKCSKCGMDLKKVK